MKILNTISLYHPNIKYQNNTNKQTKHSRLHFDTISFGALNKEFIKLSTYEKILYKFQKLKASILGCSDKASSYNLDFFEGIQEGIKVFDGLSLKDISFIGENLHTIAVKQGCYSRCIHCYAQAKKPLESKKNNNIINTILFEDLKALVQGFRTLEKRTGLSFISEKMQDNYKALVYDADCIDIAIKDLKGNVYEFPELANMIYKTLHQKCVFDTSGWNPRNIRLQQRAERIAEYYSKHKDSLYQFNISINPFHSIYTKALEMQKQCKIETSEMLYNCYVERIANAIFTFIPVCKNYNFGLIIRAFSENIDGTEGFNTLAIKQILNDIYINLYNKCKNDLQTNKSKVKSQKQFQLILEKIKADMSNIDTNIIFTDNLEKRLKLKSPKNNSCNEIDRLIIQRDEADELYIALKNNKRIKNFNTKYYKVIDVTGKVYLSDNYRVIPTKLKLNFINKDKMADTFHPLPEDLINI